MVLKKNYSLNNIIKHSQYGQFKSKQFPFTLKKMLTKKQVFKKTLSFLLTHFFFLKKNDSLFQYLFSKVANMDFPKKHFYPHQRLCLDNKKYLGHKKIQTKFQKIVKDQKKRAAFAQNELKKVTYRVTLSSFEAQLEKSSGLVRCHRSYLVNLKNVENISGNAQGLKLELKNQSEMVPVSRKYIPIVRQFFVENQ